MHRLQYSLTTTLAIASAAVVAGCGGTSTPNSTATHAKVSPTPLTAPASPAQFRALYNADRARLAQAFTTMSTTMAAARHGTAGELAATLNRLAYRFRPELAGLARLTPPASVAGSFAALVASANRIQRDLRTAAGASGRGDFSVVKAAIDDLTKEFNSAGHAGAAITHKLRLH